MTIQERDEILKDVKVGGSSGILTEEDLWEIAKFAKMIKKDKQKKKLLTINFI